jgi:hypothetical protein
MLTISVRASAKAQRSPSETKADADRDGDGILREIRAAANEVEITGTTGQKNLSTVGRSIENSLGAGFDAGGRAPADYCPAIAGSDIRAQGSPERVANSPVDEETESARQMNPKLDTQHDLTDGQVAASLALTAGERQGSANIDSFELGAQTKLGLDERYTRRRIARSGAEQMPIDDFASGGHRKLGGWGGRGEHESAAETEHMTFHISRSRNRDASLTSGRKLEASDGF